MSVELCFLGEVRDELGRARIKFPSNARVFAALAEEFGEVANALLERGYGDDDPAIDNDLMDAEVWDECVQTAAMAMRLAVETDPDYEYEMPSLMVRPANSISKLLGAIDILTRVHTRDDHQIGFNVQMGATPDFFTPSDMYVDSWKTLREFIGKPVTFPPELEDA